MSLAARPEAPSPWWFRHALPIILLAAVGLRAYACWNLGCIDRNGVQFVNFARQLAADPIDAMKTTTRQPAFAWMLLGTQRLIQPYFGGDTPESWQAAGQCLALLGGVAVCVCAYLLTLRLFDRETAILAGLMAALWPHGVELSSGVLSDMPHLAIYLVAMILGMDAMRKAQAGRLAACGFLCGLAYLLRQEALGLLAAIAICWLWPGSGRSRRKQVVGLVLMAIAFAAAAAPHSIATGRFMPNKNPLDLIRHLFAMSPDGGSSILAYIVSPWMAPGRLVEDWSRSGRHVIAALFLASLFLKDAPRAAADGRRLILVAVGLQALLMQARAIVYGELSARYVVIPLVLCIPWAASALRHILLRVATGIPGLTPRGRVMVLIMGLVLPLSPLLAYALRPGEAAKAHYPEAGRWLRAALSTQDTVMAHKDLEQFMFYADLIDPEPRWVKCDRADGAEALRPQWAAHRPTWFVDIRGSHHGELEESEHFRRLLAGDAPELRLIESIGPERRRVYIFRVMP